MFDLLRFFAGCGSHALYIVQRRGVYGLVGREGKLLVPVRDAVPVGELGLVWFGL